MVIQRTFFQLYLLLALVACIAASDSSSSTSQSSMKVCSDSDIEVTGLSILCDSPGTFYYGSGKYRDNPYCKSGDKAHVTVSFEVIGDLTDIDPLLTLTAKGDGETVTIYQNARLCYLGTLKSKTSGVSCGGMGNFTLQTQFYWAKDSDSTYQAFEPYVTVGFHSEKDPNKYDLGGANTNMCYGNTFVAWSKEIRHSRLSGPFMSIVMSAFVLIATLAGLGMFALYLWRRPQTPKDSYDAYYEDSVDYDRKIVLIRNGSGIVAF